MKKLMIAAAIVATAFISQGAAVTWKWKGAVSDGYNDGEGTYSGTVYLFNANETGISQQAILNALNEGGSLTDFASLDNMLADEGTAPGSKTIADPYTSFTGATRTEGTKTYYDYFYAAVATDESGNDYVYLSETFSTVQQTSKDTQLSSSLADSLSKTDSTSFDGSNWYAVSVPEPTSGLLLLLGVAGLALRRRRA